MTLDVMDILIVLPGACDVNGEFLLAFHMSFISEDSRCATVVSLRICIKLKVAVLDSI